MFSVRRVRLVGERFNICFSQMSHHSTTWLLIVGDKMGIIPFFSPFIQSSVKEHPIRNSPSPLLSSAVMTHPMLPLQRKLHLGINPRRCANPFQLHDSWWLKSEKKKKKCGMTLLHPHCSPFFPQPASSNNFTYSIIPLSYTMQIESRSEVAWRGLAMSIYSFSSYWCDYFWRRPLVRLSQRWPLTVQHWLTKLT